MLLMSFLQVVSRACENSQYIARGCRGDTYHLVKFAVLHHHRVDNSQEALIGWKEASSPGECVA